MTGKRTFSLTDSARAWLSQGRNKAVAGAAALVAMGFLAYLPALGAGFVWDDSGYVVQNLTLRSLDGLYRIWFVPSSNTQYYPLVFSVFWLEYHLWGLTPLGYHVANLALYSATLLVLWSLLRRLRIPGAWMITAVFALHPLHVESVVWVCELKDVLSGLFFFLALVYWVKFLRHGSRSFYGVTFALFLLAVLAKTATVVLPCVLLLLIWWEKDRVHPRDALLLAPFFLASLAFGLFHMFLETRNIGDAAEAVRFAFGERLRMAATAFWFYPRKIVWPSGLTPVYPKWNLNPSGWGWVAFPGLVVGVFLLLWGFRRRLGKAPLIAYTYYAVMIFLALGFISQAFYRFAFVADHFQYLAGLGWIALIVGSLWCGVELSKSRALRVIAGTAAVAVLLVLGVLTWRHALDFRNNHALWSHAVAINPESAIAQYNLAGAFLDEKDPRLALPHLETALRIQPDYIDAIVNLGYTLNQLGHSKQAIDHCRKAIDRFPGQPSLYVTLAVALETEGKQREATEILRKAVELKPDHPGAQFNLGLLLYRQHEFTKAVDPIATVLRHQPDDADALHLLGCNYRELGKPQEALDYLARAAELKPTPTFLNDLGMSYLALGDLAHAETPFEQALEMEPRNVLAAAKLGGISVRKGAWKRAVRFYKQALETNPDSPAVLNDLAWVLATAPDEEVRNPQASVDAARRATALSGGNDPAFLDTLAAAYASAGDFDRAVQTAGKGCTIARKAGKEALAKDIETRLVLYKKEHAFIEPDSSRSR